MKCGWHLNRQAVNCTRVPSHNLYQRQATLWCKLVELCSGSGSYVTPAQWSSNLYNLYQNSASFGYKGTYNRIHIKMDIAGKFGFGFRIIWTFITLCFQPWQSVGADIRRTAGHYLETTVKCTIKCDWAPIWKVSIWSDATDCEWKCFKNSNCLQLCCLF